LIYLSGLAIRVICATLELFEKFHTPSSKFRRERTINKLPAEGVTFNNMLV